MVSAVIEPSEEEFLQQVLELARWCGWRVHHQRPARTARGWRTALQGDPGFCDLVLCRPPRLILAELKSRRGSVSDDQRRWVEALAQCAGVEVGIWRPNDWGSIVQVLKRQR